MDEHQTAKQTLQDFFLKQGEEAFRMYDRVSVCQCQHLGGEHCLCSQNEHVSETCRTGVNDGANSSGFENGFDDKTDFIRMASDSTANGDTSTNEDSAIQDVSTSRDSALPANSRHLQTRMYKLRYKKTMIWKTRMLRRTASGEDVYIKPNIIRQSTMEEQSCDLRNPLVLVINNKDFKGLHLPRNGCDADVENVRTFLTTANFEFKLRENCEKKEMYRLFKETRDDPLLENYDGLMCFIMSHGSEKGILTADHSYIQVDEITAMFSGDQCPVLGNKPKLFFIQACRGDDNDLGFRLNPRGCDIMPDTQEKPDNIPVTLPTDIDILVAFSTTKGKAAYRQYMPDGNMMQKHQSAMGSWFIACLTQVLLVYSHQEDLLTMLTRVNKAMSELYTIDNYKQISCYLSMMTKRVYFPTVKDGNSNEQ